MHTFTLSIENVFSNKVFDKLCYLIIILIFRINKNALLQTVFGDFALNGELASEYTNVYKYLKS